MVAMSAKVAMNKDVTTARFMILLPLWRGLKLLFLELIAELLHFFTQLFQLLLDPLVLIHELLDVAHLRASSEASARELTRWELAGERSIHLTRSELSLARLTGPFGKLLIAITQRHRDFLFLIVAHHGELDLSLWLHLMDVRDQLGRVVDLLSIDLDNDVAGP